MLIVKEVSETVFFKEWSNQVFHIVNLEQDISHWQSMCYETPLRFNISLREIFSKSGSPIVMKKYDESALRQISHDLGLFNMLIVKGVSEMVFFKEWSNQGFHSL